MPKRMGVNKQIALALTLLLSGSVMLVTFVFGLFLAFHSERANATTINFVTLAVFFTFSSVCFAAALKDLTRQGKKT